MHLDTVKSSFSLVYTFVSKHVIVFVKLPKAFRFSATTENMAKEIIVVKEVVKAKFKAIGW